MKTIFRVSRSYPKILRNRKRRIQRRLAPRNWEDQEQPMLRGSNIHYELSDKTRATGYGGMGAVHLMVQRLGLVEEIDRNLELLKVHLPYHESDHVLNIAYNVLAGRITLRGDTDFTHTAQLDGWDQEGLLFILGMDAHPKVVQLAEGLSKQSWRPLERLPKYEILTEPRRGRQSVKEQIVVRKGYLNQKLVAEHVSDMTYQPHQCERKYRLVILRKNISVQKSERVLFDEVRYFFYLTNRWDLSVEQIVSLANGRCDQENVIERDILGSRHGVGREPFGSAIESCRCFCNHIRQRACSSIG